MSPSLVAAAVRTMLVKPRSSLCWTRLLALSSGRYHSTGAPSDKVQQWNINHALKKKDEGHSFQHLVGQASTVLQGIGPVHAQQLEELGLTTVEKLANYKFYHIAKSLVVLASVEEVSAATTATATEMNLAKALDKEWENASLQEILKQPPEILQGISAAKSQVWGELGVKTVQDLATYKYCLWAEAIQTASNYEE